MNRLPTKLATSLLLGASALLMSPADAAANDKVYTFGIVPQQSASRLAKMWVPALAKWGEAAGVTLKFTTAKDIPTFEACLASGAYDFAYMNPYHYTVFHDVSGYEAFAHQREKRLKGLIVVRKEAGHDSLADLDDSKIAFPSPAAFGASVIPRAELTSQNVAFEPTYVKSHDSVYRAVAAGMFEAGGGVLRTFNTIEPALREQLKVVYRTNGYTPHAFAAGKTVDAGVVSRVSLAMTGTGADSAVLSALGFSGVQAASNEDWNDVRALNLEAAQTEIVDQETLACHSE